MQQTNATKTFTPGTSINRDHQRLAPMFSNRQKVAHIEPRTQRNVMNRNMLILVPSGSGSGFPAFCGADKPAIAGTESIKAATIRKYHSLEIPRSRDPVGTPSSPLSAVGFADGGR